MLTALRVINRDDYEFLRSMEQGGHLATTYRFRGVSVAPEAYPAALWEAVLAQYLVIDRQAIPIGIVAAYGADLRNGYCRIAGAVREEAVGTGAGADALHVFATNLFRAFPLRKLYADVLEFNLPSVERGLLSSGFVVEGRSQGHEYHDGRFWDLVHFALWKDHLRVVDGQRLAERLVRASLVLRDASND